MKKCVVMIAVFLIVFTIFGIDAYAQVTDHQQLNTMYQKGIAAYKAKDYAGFLRYFKALHKLRPNNHIFIYNVAGGYALTNEKDKSIKYLNMLVSFDANKDILKDADFDSIRNTPEFKEIVKKINQLWTPVTNSRTAFTVKQRDLHPGGIAYDPESKRFYLSSVRKRQIVYIEKDGQVKEFTTPKQDKMFAGLGMRIDPKRRLLWITSSAVPQMLDFSINFREFCVVYKYNLDTKKLIKEYLLSEGAQHFFSDLTLQPDGSVYVSDARMIYRISPGSDQLEEYISSPKFRMLQGLVFCDDGRKLLAADRNAGIFIIDTASKKVEGLLKHPDNISLIGIEGLNYHKKSNSLIAIQNGLTPIRICRFYLSSDFSTIEKVETIESANPIFNRPTKGTMVDGYFYYIANNQANKYEMKGGLFSILPNDKLDDLIILKTKID